MNYRTLIHLPLPDLLAEVARMDRATLQSFASFADPNGCWTDQAFDLEFGGHQSTEDLREAVADMLREAS